MEPEGMQSVTSEQGHTWLTLSDVGAGVKDNPSLREDALCELYLSTVRALPANLIPSDLKSFDMIERDVTRTFSASGRLSTNTARDRLRRLLAIIAIVDREMGYCQGMNFLGGFLLMHMSELDAFIVMSRLLYGQQYHMRGLYLNGLPDVAVHGAVLKRLIASTMPQLHDHMEEVGADGAMFFEWYFTLFVVILPPDLARAAVTNFLADGWPAAYALVLALLEHLQVYLLGQDAFGTITALKAYANAQVAANYSGALDGRGNYRPGGRPSHWTGGGAHVYSYGHGAGAGAGGGEGGGGGGEEGAGQKRGMIIRRVGRYIQRKFMGLMDFLDSTVPEHSAHAGASGLTIPSTHPPVHRMNSGAPSGMSNAMDAVLDGDPISAWASIRQAMQESGASAQAQRVVKALQEKFAQGAFVLSPSALRGALSPGFQTSAGWGGVTEQGDAAPPRAAVVPPDELQPGLRVVAGMADEEESDSPLCVEPPLNLRHMARQFQDSPLLSAMTVEAMTRDVRNRLRRPVPNLQRPFPIPIEPAPSPGSHGGEELWEGEEQEL